MKPRCAVMSFHYQGKQSLSVNYNNKDKWEKFINSLDKMYNRTNYFNIATEFETGNSVERNLNHAAYFYFLAAQQIDDGKNELAFSKLEKLATLSHCLPSIYNYLSICYEMGFQTIRDPLKASLFLKKAAELGDLEANFNLGVRYQYGQDCLKDTNKAIKCYRLVLQGSKDDTDNKLVHLVNQNLIKIAMENKPSILKSQELILALFFLESYYMELVNCKHESLKKKHEDKLNHAAKKSCIFTQEDISDLNSIEVLNALRKPNRNLDRIKTLSNSYLTDTLGKQIREYLNYIQIIDSIAHQLKDKIACINSTLNSQMFIFEKNSNKTFDTVKRINTIINQMNPQNSLALLQIAVTLLGIAQENAVFQAYFKPLYQLNISTETPTASTSKTAPMNNIQSLKLDLPVQKNHSTSSTASTVRFLPPPTSNNPVKRPSQQRLLF